MAQTMHASFISAAGAPREASDKTPGNSVFARLFDALVESRRRSAEREIRRHQHVIDQFNLRQREDGLPFGRG